MASDIRRYRVLTGGRPHVNTVSAAGDGRYVLYRDHVDLLCGRDEEIGRLREQLVLADRLAATVEAALTFHPDREVERIPERLPAIGEALAAFRAAREEEGTNG